MYSQGETFYYDIEDEEYELTVLETFRYEDVEYIIAEDFDGRFYAFFYDENEDDIIHVSDSHDEDSIISYWKEEHYLDGDNSGYDDEDYYDRDDEDYYDKYDGFHEVEDENYY